MHFITAKKLKRVKEMCCQGNFIWKGKINKRNNKRKNIFACLFSVHNTIDLTRKILINKIPINAVLTGKDLLKIGVRDTLVYLKPTLSR